MRACASSRANDGAHQDEHVLFEYSSVRRRLPKCATWCNVSELLLGGVQRLFHAMVHARPPRMFAMMLESVACR